MYKQSPILLLLLLLLIFSPSLVSWILSTEGAWYRLYVIWLVVIIITYFIQRSVVKNRDP